MRVLGLIKMLDKAAEVSLIWIDTVYWVFNIGTLNYIYMSRKVRKRTFGRLRPAKIQISLRIRAVWSESSLGAIKIAYDAKF